MPTLRSLTTCARPLNRRAALALAGLALSLALIVGSSPAHAARRPAAAPSQTTKAPPVLSPHTREALVSKFDRSLSKLGKRPTLQQLRAVGLRPASAQHVAQFKGLQSHHLARAATAGATYASTWQYYGNTWVDEYYDGPYSAGPYPGVTNYYIVYFNFKTCTPAGIDCFDANAYTYEVYGAFREPLGNLWYGWDTPYGQYPYPANPTDDSLGWGPYAG